MKNLSYKFNLKKIMRRILKGFWIALLLLAVNIPVMSQGFQPPSQEKAVVYFVRVTKYGKAVSFEFFHNDKYIGAFKGKNYMRYECDAGEQLFWASSENREFLAADLKEGGTYIVIVDVIMGFWKGHVGLTPIDENSTELFEQAKKLVLSKAPVEISQQELDKKNRKLADFIPKELKHYEEVTKDKYDFKHISPDMDIPEDMLK